MMSSPVDTSDPAYPSVLADAACCPSCFAAAARGVCAECGLDLDDARIPRVRSLGRQILGLELERGTTLRAIRATQADAAARARADHAAREAEAARAAETARAAEAARAAERALDTERIRTGAATGSAPTSEPAAPGAPAWPSPRPLAPASVPRRRLTVPALLLTVGVSLVGIAAVFFLLLAWFVWGLAVRAMIIGAITLATIGISTWLRRRALTATAEGIAALGILLLGLDAWAIRANDLFATGATDAVTYAGVAALAVGVAARAWARLSGLRVPDIAAAVSVPAGVGLLVAGVPPLEPAVSTAAGLLAAAAATLSHSLPVPWSTAARDRAGVPTRLVAAVLGIAALAAAAVVSIVAIGDVGALVAVNLLVCAIGLAHARLLLPSGAARRLPAAGALAATASTIAAALAALTGWQTALRTGGTPDPLLYAPVIAVIVAVVADIARVRMPRLRPAALTAGAVAALSIVGTGTAWWVRAGEAMTTSWIPWYTDALLRTGETAWSTIAAIPVALVLAALLFAAPALAAPRLRDARAVIAAALVLSAGAAPAVPLLAVGVSLAVAAIAVFACARAVARAGSDLRAPSRTGWIIVAVAATAAAYLESTATPRLWVVAVTAAIVLPIALRLVLRTEGAASVVLAVTAVGVAAISAVVAPAPLGAVLGVTGSGVAAAILLVQAVALGAFGVALLVPTDRAARSALALSGEVLLAITLLATVGQSVVDAGAGEALAERLGAPVTGFVSGCLLLAALVATARSGSRLSTAAALGAAGLAAPTLALALHHGLAALGPDATPWRPVVLLASAVIVVVLVAWGGLRRPLRDGMRALRASAEVGAVVTALATVWSVDPDRAWAALGLAALGFAAMSVTAGWIGVATSTDDDVFATSADGTPLAVAPRRLFVWPAAFAAVAAWWLWLGAVIPGMVFPVESYAIPAGAALAGLACALVWLRRRVEASVALALGLAIGLGVPALASAVTDARAIAVATVAAALCLALSLTPVRRVRPTAPVGAAVALAALGTVAIGRAVTHGTWETAWLLLFAGAAIASGFGFARTRPERASSRAYAEAVTPLAIAATTIAVIPSARHAAVVTVALALLTLLHVASAASGRAPLGAVTRWTAFAGATAVATAGLALGALGQVEAATLPLAGALLAGAVVSALRRRRAGLAWPAAESLVWLAGLALATVPSLFAPLDSARMTTVIGAALAGAIGVALAPIPAAWRVRVPSAVLLAGSAHVMGARALVAAPLAGSEAMAFGAALGAVAVAAVLIATSPDTEATRLTTLLTAAGAALAVALVLVRSDGELVRTTATVLAAGLTGVAVAPLLRLRAWRAFAGVVAMGAAVIAVAGCGIRFFVVISRAGYEADFWVLIAVLVVVSIAVAAVRAADATAAETTAGEATGAQTETAEPAPAAVSRVVGGTLAALVPLPAAAELALIALGDSADVWRTTFTMIALVAATRAAVAWRGRLGVALAVGAGVSGVLFAVVATLAFGVRPFEVVTLPAAIGGLAYGASVLARHPSARSWPVLGPWIALLTLPSLAYDAASAPGLGRVVTLGVVALTLVVAGALLRLQAPLVLGSIVLLVHGAAQLWPWISAAYEAVPWWLWLGIGGSVLIFLAATYERRVRQMRTAFTAVASLR